MDWKSEKRRMVCNIHTKNFADDENCEYWQKCRYNQHPVVIDGKFDIIMRCKNDWTKIEQWKCKKYIIISYRCMSTFNTM